MKARAFSLNMHRRTANEDMLYDDMAPEPLMCAEEEYDDFQLNYATAQVFPVIIPCLHCAFIVYHPHSLCFISMMASCFVSDAATAQLSKCLTDA